MTYLQEYNEQLIKSDGTKYYGAPPSNVIPPVISGYAGWWDVSQVSGQSDGTALAELPDLSGNGYNYTQATAGHRPIFYNQTSGKLVNGRPALWFTATSDQCMDNTGPIYAASNTVFIVGSGASGTDAYLDGSNNSYAHGPSFIYGYTSGELQYYNNISDLYSADEEEFAVIGSGTFVACWTQEDGENLTGYINSTNAAFSVTPENAISGITNNCLGSSVDGSGNYYTGAICEKIIYLFQLTPTQIAAEINALLEKWT